MYIWVRKLDSDSFTETKNWRGRNEITETSGRLHPSWPQNKWLYTPWTKDYRHTRQDRWIQTELAFTLAKNATKPKPVEIIPLQTTRKENNWKTEETLARTVVTLETERIRLVQSLMFMMMMICICMCIYLHMYVLVCMYECVCVCVCVCVYACMYVCMYSTLLVKFLLKKIPFFKYVIR